MQPMLLTDYLLGNAFSKKYAGTFVEEAPTYIYYLPETVLIRDELGNYKFQDNDELTEPFIKMSYLNKSIGNFFIAFQRYMKAPLNIIQEKTFEYNYNFIYKKEFTCYLKPKGLFDEDKELIQDVFVSLVPEFGEVILIYFYAKSKKVGHLRTTLTNLQLGLNIRDYDKKILSTVQEFIKSEEIKPMKDIIKDKYKGRFTQQEYFLL